MKIEYTLLGNQKYELEFVNGYGNSVAIDVATSEDISFGYGDFKLIPLGFALKLPQGYKAELRPRSSTFKKYGIIQTNSIGLIDSTYGESLQDMYILPAFRPLDSYAMGLLFAKNSDVLEDKITVPKGTRIGQIEIVKCMDNIDLVKLSNEEYEKKYNKSRGGFGSTGEK